MNKDSKIYIAGHRGMVGSAILRKLQKDGFKNFALRTSSELDLRNQSAVQNFFETEKPEYVFLAAAKVGGIQANNIYRAEFIYDNLAIETNIIHASCLNKVKKLLFLGSSCIYPKNAPQPMKEEYMLTGELEPTNEPYAIAKIAGLKMCESYNRQYGCNFFTVLPTNLYGPNDNYDLNNSHVLPALLRKFHEAKINNEPFVVVWGSGKPKREFMHVDDLADACVFLMQNYDKKDSVNIGSSQEVTIAELAQLIKKITGYNGELQHDSSKPDGVMRKLLDSSRINNFGWKPKISLEEGIKKTYESFKQQTVVAS
jgi:GDP-L-fucose synthase